MNRFETSIEDKRKEVQECKESKVLPSCNKCDEFYSCIIRIDYANSTYESLEEIKGMKFV